MLKKLPFIFLFFFLFIAQAIIATHVHTDFDEDSSNSQCIQCQMAMQLHSLKTEDINISLDSIQEIVYKDLFPLKNHFYQNVHNITLNNRAPPQH